MTDRSITSFPSSMQTVRYTLTIGECDDLVPFEAHKRLAHLLLCVSRPRKQKWLVSDDGEGKGGQGPTRPLNLGRQRRMRIHPFTTHECKHANAPPSHTHAHHMYIGHAQPRGLRRRCPQHRLPDALLFLLPPPHLPLSMALCSVGLGVETEASSSSLRQRAVMGDEKGVDDRSIDRSGRCASC